MNHACATDACKILLRASPVPSVINKINKTGTPNEGWEKEPSVVRKKERKKTDNPREGWEDGTPPPHRDFKVVRGSFGSLGALGVQLAASHPGPGSSEAHPAGRMIGIGLRARDMRAKNSLLFACRRWPRCLDRAISALVREATDAGSCRAPARLSSRPVIEWTSRDGRETRAAEVDSAPSRRSHRVEFRLSLQPGAAHAATSRCSS